MGKVKSNDGLIRERQYERSMVVSESSAVQKGTYEIPPDDPRAKNDTRVGC